MITASAIALAGTTLFRAQQPGVTAFHAMFGLAFTVFWKLGLWALPIVIVGQFL